MGCGGCEGIQLPPCAGGGLSVQVEMSCVSFGLWVFLCGMREEQFCSEQAVMAVSVQCPAHPDPSGAELGGVAMSSFLFPHLSVLWGRIHGSGQEKEMRSSICISYP